MAPTYLLSIATELLATDVLGVVMAPTMWARREKSSAGFHFLAGVPNSLLAASGPN
jgi:hypothetical protein